MASSSVFGTTHTPYFVATIPESVLPESFNKEFQHYRKTLKEKTTYLVSKMQLNIREPGSNLAAKDALNKYFQGMGYPTEADWRRNCEHRGRNGDGMLTYAIGVLPKEPFAQAIHPTIGPDLQEQVEKDAVAYLSNHPIFHFAYPPIDFSSLRRMGVEEFTKSGFVAFLQKQGFFKDSLAKFASVFSPLSIRRVKDSYRLTANRTELEEIELMTQPLEIRELIQKIMQGILEDAKTIDNATREYFERIGLLDAHASESLRAWLEGAIQERVPVKSLAGMIADYLNLDVTFKIQYQGVTIHQRFPS